MVQGTTSDAGKSTLVSALCRWMARRGMRVAPFKPQNMALNSAVTPEGGEIGRAQAVQALAAKIAPHADMNPVLLKPCTMTGAQVIVQGKAIGNMEAGQYHSWKKIAKVAVFDSYRRLSENYSHVIVEGAGSPAEINLREGDIANMGFAEEADCPVILIADIDRGGVFAHLVGTLALLSENEQKRVKGFVINRFRGEISLLEPGLAWLERYTGKPVLGVLPHLHGLFLEAEDAIPGNEIHQDGKFRVIVPVLRHISNHTDFDPLRLHPGIRFEYVPVDSPFPPADLLILPGSKSVRSDLEILKEREGDILRHLRYGGKIIGICGGLQMLGKWIRDPDGIEGEEGESEGLGLLDLETRLCPEKMLRNVTGALALDGASVSGYEIHAGISEGPALENPAILLGQGGDGAISGDGRIFATYLHGLFESQKALESLLKWAGLESMAAPDHASVREANLERLADAVEQHLDMEKILAILEGKECAN